MGSSHRGPASKLLCCDVAIFVVDSASSPCSMLDLQCSMFERFRLFSEREHQRYIPDRPQLVSLAISQESANTNNLHAYQYIDIFWTIDLQACSSRGVLGRIFISHGQLSVEPRPLLGCGSHGPDDPKRPSESWQAGFTRRRVAKLIGHLDASTAICMNEKKLERPPPDVLLQLFLPTPASRPG